MDPVTVLTYNVRHAILDDGVHSWANRREGVTERIRAADPDVIGVQECAGDQQAELAAGLPVEEWVGVADAGSGEHVPIGARTPWEPVEAETRWLSASGEVGSVGWDGKYPRVVTTAVLQHRESGQRLTVCNTHFDHVGKRARLESARVLREHVDAQPPDRPVVVLGDFNAHPGSAPYKRLTGADFERELRDARTVAAETSGPTVTFTDFESVADGRTLDHVFVTTDLDVQRYSVDPTKENGQYPSDHLPVLVTVEL